MIRIRDLHKYYGERHLFKGINLDINRGEIVALIGPSGSGKSTLLRCLNGLETFQKGEIDVEGAELHSINRARPSKTDREAIRQVRLKVGMVFQQFNLFPHMTVMENIIEAPVHVLGMDKDAACRMADSFLERINLKKLSNSYPPFLSGGEQQRVAIVRALAMNPEAMLFDEPTSSLDPEMTGEVLSVIRDLVGGGMTTLISSHEMGFVREVADRILVLDGGDIIDSGPPEIIFTNPNSERTKTFLSRVLK